MAAKTKKPPERVVPTLEQIRKGLHTLADILQKLRWDDQGGYVGRTDGKWNFVSTSLPQTTPEELDALFAAVGLVPDEIEALGTCAQCMHAVESPAGHWHEQGYAGPCSPCKRPRMSNFVPRTALTKKRKK